MSGWNAAPTLTGFVSFVQNGMQIPAAALPASIVAPAAPGLTAGSGGSLPSGTLYVVVTYTSAYGETTASPEASVAVTGPSGQVTVTSPAAQTGVTGYRVYAASATGAEVLQSGTTPIAIGTAFPITSLATGTAVPPTANTASSPYPGYAFNQAMALVLFISAVPQIEYTTAVYNCAGHILLKITPDQPGQTFFSTARQNYGMLEFQPGVISTAGDQGTGDSFATPDGLKNLTVSDLNFLTTPFGREFIGYSQDFGSICGLT